MRQVTMDDVNACIREWGLYGWSTSDLRQLMRECPAQRDLTSQIRHAAARHVLVGKLNKDQDEDETPVVEMSTGLLEEYTRLHGELAEILSTRLVSRSVLKDDYHRLIDTLERVNRARRQAGLEEIPLDEDC